MAFNPSFLTRRFIQVGIEATKGSQAGTITDVLVNTGAAFTGNSNFVERAVDSAEFGTFGGVHTSKTWGVTIQAENKGGGASSPVPEINGLLQASALTYAASKVLPITGASGDFTIGEMVTSNDVTPATARVLAQTATHLYVDTVTNTFGNSATITGDDSAVTATGNGAPITSAVYIPESDYANQKTITIRDVRDHDQRIVLGAMSDATFNFADSAIPTVDFAPLGIYSAPTAPVATAGTVSTVTPDAWIGATFEINGVACGDFAITSFSLALGNQVSQVPSACATDGVIGITIDDSRPVLTVVITKPPLATLNPYALRDANTKIDVFTGHGSGAGERIRIGVPQGQITQVQEGVEGNREIYTLTIAATKAGGANVPKFHVIYW